MRVGSAQGFGNSNGRLLVVPLGDQSSGAVFVNWPSGAVTEATIDAGEALHIVE